MPLSYSSGLPGSVRYKISKTGTTRGAKKAEIFQNRVARNNTALIPLSSWKASGPPKPDFFESGFIIIASPEDYFNPSGTGAADDLPEDLVLGQNLLVYFRSRGDWERFDPEGRGWTPATSREAPLGGQYIARVPNTTSKTHNSIFRGFTGGGGAQGAGIRFFEYASGKTIEQTRYQLAYLAWRTEGMEELARESGVKDPSKGKRHVDKYCEANGLATQTGLEEARLVVGSSTVCPLCLKPIEAAELASRIEQAAGREIEDLTTTAVNLFHIQELRPGVFNHKVYNLGWGHHHCNTVVRDYGLPMTLAWMEATLRRNGYEVSGPPGPDAPLP